MEQSRRPLVAQDATRFDLFTQCLVQVNLGFEVFMARYIFRRILISLPVLLGITLITFFLLHASGDPMAVYSSNPSLTAEDLERLEKTYGFDKPVYVQYLYWL